MIKPAKPGDLGRENRKLVWAKPASVFLLNRKFRIERDCLDENEKSVCYNKSYMILHEKK